MSKTPAAPYDGAPNKAAEMSRITRSIHTFLWPLLPQKFRRRLLFMASSWMAPAIASSAQPCTPWITAGALSTASGLGEGARLQAAALRDHGALADQATLDLSSGLLQPIDLPTAATAPQASLRGKGVILLHVNAPFMAFALWNIGREIVADKYIIGYWAWELSKVPPDWGDGARHCHEIWVPSRFVADAVRPIAGNRPVKVVPHPVLSTRLQSCPSQPHDDGTFRALCVFNAASSFTRKNPIASVQAFKSAFGADASAQLIVKIANADVYPAGLRQLQEECKGYPNIRLMCETVSQDEINALYERTHVVMSLHRSEGFGLVIAEAMMRGIPVIATDWSGNTDFFSGDVGVPVPYTLIPARDPQETYTLDGAVWAEPSVAHAADALLRLRSDAGFRRELGRRGRDVAAARWNTASFAEEVQRCLSTHTARQTLERSL